ncbi:MAG TPA: cytochrome b/b6 domain-containing protein [candidate division Zixibacteria bacterium]|nr:cytochrome b/b6 domain-containing protein [candidate division Zixibacteria bacterium]
MARAPRILALLPACGWLVATLAGAAPSAAPCESCHGVPGLEKERGGKTVSLHVDAEAFAATPHGPLGCAACHAAMAQFPHPPKAGTAPCSTCHAPQAGAHAAGVHAKLKDRLPEAASCFACHGNVHRLARAADPAAPTNRQNIARTCARCHADTALAEKFRIPVVRPVEAYLQSVHARAVARGKAGAVCSDCHGSHGILPASDAASPISHAKIPETCGKCHGSVVALYRESVHGEAAARGVRGAPVCTDCHGEHRILGPAEPDSPVFTANIPGHTCGRCHGDARMSERFGLPPDKVPAFQDSFHGLALRAGQLTAANCASCHGVHDIRPSSDPRSHVHSANLARTCGKCHPGAGQRFALGPVHVLPQSGGPPVLYWIRLIYLWVIGVTIGLMALHNALDLVRKARRREEAPFEPPGVVPERMSRSLRWQHGLIMVSFPLLAYTGFALTYPEAWWAAPLVHWETALGLRRYLHRAAATVLVAALAWHLVELAVSPARRARFEKQKLRWKDLRDAWLVVRYNLGVAPQKPRMGEFSYAEKIEYWAFLWGMGVMTITGLLLWFENVTLRYLPKVAADIATAVHFYEAVLATLAIVVWHLYWVIFDPDVYPMDGAWWHGRSPAARLKERAEGAGEPTGDGGESDGR